MPFGMGGDAMSLSDLAGGGGGGDFQQNPNAQNPGGVPGMTQQLFAAYDMAVQTLKRLADIELDESRGSKLAMMAAQLNQMKVDRKREIEQMQQQVARAGVGAM